MQKTPAYAQNARLNPISFASFVARVKVVVIEYMVKVLIVKIGNMNKDRW